MKYGTDHSTIDAILNKHGIQRFGQRAYNGQKIKAEKDEKVIHFNSISDCADYLIANNITKSKTFQTVKQWVSDVANNRKESYYGWKFSKE